MRQEIAVESPKGPPNHDKGWAMTSEHEIMPEMDSIEEKHTQIYCLPINLYHKVRTNKRNGQRP